MRIKALALQDVPKTEIARRCGVSRQTVYNHLNREPGSRARRSSTTFLLTGGRRSEVLGLERKDVDLKTGRTGGTRASRRTTRSGPYRSGLS